MITITFQYDIYINACDVEWSVGWMVSGGGFDGDDVDQNIK